MELSERIKQGWEVSAEGFSRNIVPNDFVSPGREAWTRLILDCAPRQGQLNILDAGTGPGVFATILTLAGHRVTGIDISPRMLEEARANSAKYGTAPEYREQNSQDMTEENQYDMIVSRYVVWCMEYPEKCYANWLRALKPGGRIVVFDAGHRAGQKGELPKDNSSEDAETYYKKFGVRPPQSFKDSDYEIARGWKRDLMLSYVDRPAWDVETLKKLGFVNIHWENIRDQACYDERMAFHVSGDPFFRLCADKPDGTGM